MEILRKIRLTTGTLVLLVIVGTNPIFGQTFEATQQAFIKSYDYEWKSDSTRSYGVIAHELQDIIPQAVYGEKDADEMQGVDYSKIVPILIKSIQELQAKIVTLESKIN
jgi:hypothetical protein